MEGAELHSMLVLSHALAGTVSFVGGSVAISSRRRLADRRVFSVYLWSLVAMVAFLAGAMVVWWTAYTTLERVAFTGLFVLAAYMLHRAFNARSLLQTRRGDWGREYTRHVGFTLVSLFEGFVIVALLNLGTASWTVALVATLGVVGGRQAVARAEARNETTAC